ncbi:MAG TPA: hypothetical protein VK699_19225 [Terriglobales bacterium]|nr:hypothetical protein [Terriglobales bacterium]
MRRCFFAVVVSLALIITSCSKSSDNGGGLLSKAESALTPSDPWTEFALMSAARLKATSWRSKMLMNQAGQPIEMDSEVMCPDKQHTKMTQGGKVTMESYNIGGTMYLNAGGRMMKVPSHMSAAALQCPGADSGSASSAPSSKISLGSLPSMKDLSTGLQEMEKYKQNVTITKGGVSTVEGSLCQEWNIVYNDPQTKQGYNSNYCVGVADHLPRRMIVDSGAKGKIEMTYWDWNSNISINPPTS